MNVGSEEMHFNHAIQADTMLIGGNPVLHVVDDATHYTAANYLRSQSIEGIWETLRESCMQIYVGPPDFLFVDQGTAYTSK